MLLDCLGGIGGSQIEISKCGLMSKINTENRDVWMSQRLLFVDFVFIASVGYKKLQKHRMVAPWEIMNLALIIQLRVQLARNMLKCYGSFTE